MLCYCDQQVRGKYEVTILWPSCKLHHISRPSSYSGHIILRIAQVLHSVPLQTSQLKICRSLHLGGWFGRSLQTTIHCLVLHNANIFRVLDSHRITCCPEYEDTPDWILAQWNGLWTSGVYVKWALGVWSWAKLTSCGRAPRCCDGINNGHCYLRASSIYCSVQRTKLSPFILCKLFNIYLFREPWHSFKWSWIYGQSYQEIESWMTGVTLTKWWKLWINSWIVLILIWSFKAPLLRV